MYGMYSLQEAVRMAGSDINSTSFAFYPKCGGGKVLGGTVFVVSGAGTDGATPPLSLRTLTGLVSSEVASSNIVDIRNIDDQAAALVAQYGIDPRDLFYKQCRPHVADLALGTSLRYALALLNGTPHAMPKHTAHLPTDWHRRVFQHLRMA